MATLGKRRDARAWQKEYDLRAPRVGHPAPDFELRDINGENPFRLSSFQGKKPVVLIFGSYT